MKFNIKIIVSIIGFSVAISGCVWGMESSQYLAYQVHQEEMSGCVRNLSEDMTPEMTASLTQDQLKTLRTLIFAHISPTLIVRMAQLFYENLGDLLDEGAEKLYRMFTEKNS